MPGKLNRIRKYQWIKRMRTHGFRKRMQTASGRNVLKRRRAKGRHRIVVQKSGR